MKSKSNVLCVVIAGLFWTINGCNSSSNNSDLLSVIPPFENLSVKTLDFNINNDQDTLLNLSNGTSVNIPKNAFLTKDGQPVSGKVNIQFKQFDNPLKVIASGIPMIYTDQQGNQQQMESAGMFDIRGFSNNQEIVIKNDKSLDVNLASNINGDFDLFYFEEDETKTKGKWNTLSKNTLTDINNESIGRILSFDTTGFPETKLLSGIKFNISKKEDSDSSDWIYQQEWNVLDISKPSFIPSIVDKFKFNEQNDGWISHLSPDSNFIKTLYDKKIYIRDWYGNIIKKLSHRDYSGGYFVDNDIFIAYDYNNAYYDFYDSKWELVNSLKQAYNLRTLKNKKRHIYTNVSKTNTTHFFVDIVNTSGQLIKSIKCKKHPDKSHYYAGWKLNNKKGEGLTEFRLNKDNNLIALNTGDGVQIYDVDGKQLKKIEYSDTYDDIKFLDYNDALLLEDWDNGLTVWDWKNDKFIKMPKEIKYVNSIHNSNHPNQPVLLISNRGTKSFFLWNWKKDSYTKHFTSHKIGQMYFSYGFNGAYIDEYNYDDGYARLWDNNGNEIIEIIGIPDVHASIRPVNTGNTIISNNGKEFCIYQPNGKLIRKFELTDSTYSEANEYQDKFTLYNKDGNLLFLNDNGSYLNSIQLDKESRIGWYQTISDSLIFVKTPFDAIKLYTEQGTLKYNFGKFYITHINNNLNAAIYLCMAYEENELLIIEEGQKLKDRSEYQIILQNKTDQFIGMVTLDFKTKKAIEKYQEEYLKNYRTKKRKEVKRKERESKIVRSFKVKRFGIYNWDRMYKQPNTVLCKAKLVLDKSSNQNSFNTSFLITGEKKNTVIKYYGEKIEKFAFDTTAFNQLLVILPDNRIALISDEDFKKLKTKNLSEKSELVLNLKEFDKVESMDYLNELMSN